MMAFSAWLGFKSLSCALSHWIHSAFLWIRQSHVSILILKTPLVPWWACGQGLINASSSPLPCFLYPSPQSIDSFVCADFLSNDPKAANVCYTLSGSVVMTQSPCKRADQGRHGHKVWFLFYRQIGQSTYQQTFLWVFSQISCIADLPSDISEYK